MKRIIILVVLVHFTLVNYGQLIADHRVVELYDEIPQEYIDIVKNMLVFMAGESHSGAYRSGSELLELLDGRFQVETYTTNPPPSHSDQYLRIGRPFMLGESSFFSQSKIEDLKSHISSQNNSGNPYDVMGFAWCWDMTWTNPPGGTIDPVHHVRWAGSSQGGPDGNQRWGLNDGDNVLTGNSVNMDTYINAVAQYMQHCEENGYPTQWVFTTGPVDGESNNGTEKGFQRELKHDYIREYVRNSETAILFDYADILCWNNNGEKYLGHWDDGGNIRSHAQIHPDNLKDYDSSFNIINGTDADEDHIGEVGALRIAKAMWWMLAKIAGWEGGTVSTEDGVNDIENSQLKVFVDHDIIRIEKAGEYSKGIVKLYNLNGILIANKDIESDVIEFDTSKLSSGMYIVALSKDANNAVEKVLLSK